MPDDPFWNLTDGVRPREPVPGMFASICADMGHVHDDHYGPNVCARCGHDRSTPRASLWRRRARLLRALEGDGEGVPDATR